MKKIKIAPLLLALVMINASHARTDEGSTMGHNETRSHSFGLPASPSQAPARILNDNGGISATPISFVVDVKSETDILKAIQQANKQHIPVAIMGKQHSQGGQTLINNAIEVE